MRTPSHSSPTYVAGRVRRLLAAKGWPIHLLKGRYEPFGGGSQAAEEGYSVGKVGCGRFVSVSYCARFSDGRSADLPRGFARERTKEAIVHLRSLGYRIDERGWIECDRHDPHDR